MKRILRQLRSAASIAGMAAVVAATVSATASSASMGALTRAGAGGVSAPSGATAISGGTATGYSLTGGFIVPTSNGSATSGTLTFTGSAVTVTMTTVANAYSVKNKTEWAAVVALGAATISGKTILLRDGNYDAGQETMNSASFTSTVTVKGHSIWGATIILNNAALAAVSTFANQVYIKYENLRFYGEFDTGIHSTTSPAGRLTGTCGNLSFEGCEITSSHYAQALAEGFLGTNYGWLGTIGFGSGVVLNGPVTFNNCTIHSGQRLLNLANYATDHTTSGYYVLTNNSFYNFATDAVVISGMGAHQITDNVFFNPLGLSTSASHMDSVQFQSIMTGTAPASRSYGAKNVRIERNVLIGYRNDTVFESAGKDYKRNIQGIPFAEDLADPYTISAFTADTGFTKGTGWSIAGGVAAFSAGSSGAKLTTTATYDLTASGEYNLEVELKSKAAANGNIILRAYRTGENYEQAFAISSLGVTDILSFNFTTTATATGFTFEIEASDGTANFSLDDFRIIMSEGKYEGWIVRDNLAYCGTNYAGFISLPQDTIYENNTAVVDPGDVLTVNEPNAQFDAHYAGFATGAVMRNNILLGTTIEPQITASTSNNIKVDKDLTVASGGVYPYSDVFVGPVFSGLRTVADIKAAFTRKPGGPADGTIKAGYPKTDTTKPVLSSPVDTALTATTGSGSFNSDTFTGTTWWVLAPTTDKPTPGQIKRGKCYLNATPLASGSQAGSGVAAQSISFTGLSASTFYVMHATFEDAEGNLSDVVSGDGFTTSSSYTQARKTFGGAAYLTYTSDTSIADATGLTISWWMDIGAVNTSSRAIFNHALGRITITRNASNKLAWTIRSSPSGTILWDATGDTTVVDADGLTHFAIAFNGATGVGQYYRNGVAAAFTNATAPIAGTVHWARSAQQSAIGTSATSVGTAIYTGTLGDFWVDNQYFDLSSNISTFYGGGTPPDLTGIGSPAIWLGGSMSTAQWNSGTNLGNMTAALTMTGAVT